MFLRYLAESRLLAALHVPASAGTASHDGLLIRQNRRGINTMPLFFFLPFIIASGILSVAADSMSAGAKKERDR
jgi:hypothetical protein